MAPRRTLLSAIIVKPTRKIGDIDHVTWVKRVSHWIVVVGVTVVAVICSSWAFGAVWFDAPFGAGNKLAAALLLTLFAVLLVFVRGFWRKVGSFVLVFAAILFWWLSLSPTNDRNWQPDVANTAWAEIDGDQVTIHNVRNCDYRSETDYTPRWETRTFHLSKLSGVDLFINYWGSSLMAHPIASFRFSDSLPVCFSIEARKIVGQNFSPIASLYRQAELIYVVADERDSARVRAVYRHEDVYLYRTSISTDRARERFLEYLHTLNVLRTRPHWYNVLTTNCTTNIREQHPVNERMPWDWRMLVNGKGDEMMFERRLIATDGLSFSDLKQRSRINERARMADQSPDFSALIREGLPGFATN